VADGPSWDFVAPRELGRVEGISSDGHTINILLSSGAVVSFTGDDLSHYVVGDSVVMGSIDNRSALLKTDAPFELGHWIGVVKHVEAEEVICEIGGRFFLVSREGIECAVGYTVLGDNTNRLLRVITRRPLKYIDLPGDEEMDVGHFRSQDSGLSFEDFGGYSDVVKRAKELIEVPLLMGDTLEHIGAKAIRGVIFSGPPGTGKTLLAKIIASRSKSRYYEISGPEIMSKWYGDAEATLREIFNDAREHAPALIVIDEIDSVAAQRVDSSHEASKRVAQLLTLLDGLRQSSTVVVGTTNRIDDLDRALRRPGRFDWEVELRLPNAADRFEILVASSKHLSTRGLLKHSSIADATTGWTPAELAAIWSEAAILAATDGRDSISQEDYFGGYCRVRYNRQARTGRNG